MHLYRLQMFLLCSSQVDSQPQHQWRGHSEVLIDPQYVVTLQNHFWLIFKCRFDL
jgi:hypothetical protein